MKDLVLNELKVYAKEIKNKAFRGQLRRHGRKLGLSNQFINIYSKMLHPLSE